MFQLRERRNSDPSTQPPAHHLPEKPHPKQYDKNAKIDHFKKLLDVRLMLLDLRLKLLEGLSIANTNALVNLFMELPTFSETAEQPLDSYRLHLYLSSARHSSHRLDSNHHLYTEVSQQQEVHPNSDEDDNVANEVLEDMGVSVENRARMVGRIVGPSNIEIGRKGNGGKGRRDKENEPSMEFAGDEDVVAQYGEESDKGLYYFKQEITKKVVHTSYSPVPLLKKIPIDRQASGNYSDIPHTPTGGLRTQAHTARSRESEEPLDRRSLPKPYSNAGDYVLDFRNNLTGRSHYTNPNEAQLTSRLDTRRDQPATTTHSRPKSPQPNSRSPRPNLATANNYAHTHAAHAQGPIQGHSHNHDQCIADLLPKPSKTHLTEEQLQAFLARNMPKNKHKERTEQDFSQVRVEKENEGVEPATWQKYTPEERRNKAREIAQGYVQNYQKLITRSGVPEEHEVRGKSALKLRGDDVGARVEHAEPWGFSKNAKKQDRFAGALELKNEAQKMTVEERKSKIKSFLHGDNEAFHHLQPKSPLDNDMSRSHSRKAGELKRGFHFHTWDLKKDEDGLFVDVKSSQYSHFRPSMTPEQKKELLKEHLSGQKVFHHLQNPNDYTSYITDSSSPRKIDRDHSVKGFKVGIAKPPPRTNPAPVVTNTFTTEERKDMVKRHMQGESVFHHLTQTNTTIYSEKKQPSPYKGMKFALPDMDKIEPVKNTMPSRLSLEERRSLIKSCIQEGTILDHQLPKPKREPKDFSRAATPSKNKSENVGSKHFVKEESLDKSEERDIVRRVEVSRTVVIRKEKVKIAGGGKRESLNGGGNTPKNDTAQIAPKVQMTIDANNQPDMQTRKLSHKESGINFEAEDDDSPDTVEHKDTSPKALNSSPNTGPDIPNFTPGKSSDEESPAKVVNQFDDEERL
jgi:hypothetical protein